MNFVWANALLLFLVLAEIAFMLWYQREKVPWREIVFNLNSGHILMWILRGVEIQGYFLIQNMINLNLLAELPNWLQWFIGFMAWDFCFYWLHRLHHKLKILWAVHVVHHEGEHFNLSLGIRNSWYSSLTSLPFFAVLALVGLPVEIFIAVSSIHYFIQFYNHNHLVKKSGWLEYVLITPSHHRVHHGVNDRYVDRNFGGTFVFWDKLFGTFQTEEESEPVVFGVKGSNKTTDVLKANNQPFARLFGFLELDKKNHSPPFKIADRWIATLGLLLFGWLLLFVFYQESLLFEKALAFFLLVFTGTIAAGGLSENKMWGLVLWCCITFIGMPTLWWVVPALHPVASVLIGASMLHAVILLVSTSANQKKEAEW